MKIKVKVTITITSEIDSEELLEEDETASPELLCERLGERIDDGGISMDEFSMRDESDIDVAVEEIKA